MTELRALSFVVKPSHPDFKIAREQARDAKRLFNGFLALTRNYYFYKRDTENADLAISRDMGVDVTAVTLEGKHAGKDWFGYSPDSLARAEVRNPMLDKYEIDMNAKVVAAIGRKVGQAWSSYWALRKNGHRASIPKYTRGEFGVVPFNNQTLSCMSLKQGWIRPAGWSRGFQLPSNLEGIVQAAELKVISSRKFVLRVFYKSVEKPMDYRPRGVVAGLDFGMKNLMTIAFSDLSVGLIVDGKPLLKVLNKHNDAVASLSSVTDTQRGGEQKNKGRLIHRREVVSLQNQQWKTRTLIKNYYTLANNQVVAELQRAGVSKIVIGWGDDFKQSTNLGRRTNRRFMGIPHAMIRDDLIAKCHRVGIVTEVTEESYTSASSWLDADSLPVRDADNPRSYKFSGKRIKRGLYRAKNGRCINADLQGGLNIIRKVDSSFLPLDERVPRVKKIKPSASCIA